MHYSSIQSSLIWGWVKTIFSINYQNFLFCSHLQTRPNRLLTCSSTTMGGCASRPKDLDLNETAPVPVEQVESQTIAQEINGGEETKTEPLVDLSEPTEANETAEEKPAEEIAEIMAEEIPLPVEEAKEVEPEIIEDKADAPLAPIA